MDKIQERALETWYKEDDPRRFDRMYPTLKLAGEAGEFADLHGKHCYKPGFEATREQYCDELGDVLYYVSILAFQLDVTLDELSRMNYDKLKAREDNGTGYNRGEEKEGLVICEYADICSWDECEHIEKHDPDEDYKYVDGICTKPSSCTEMDNEYCKCIPYTDDECSE